MICKATESEFSGKTTDLLEAEYVVLERSWFPRFDDQTKEHAFVESVSALNRTGFARLGWVGFFGVLLVRTPDYTGEVFFNASGLKSGAIVCIACHILQLVLCAACIAYPYYHAYVERAYLRRPLVDTETFIVIGHLLIVFTFFGSNRWRVGVVAVGDGYHLLDVADCETDQMLVECLIVSSTFVFCNVVVRSRQALIFVFFTPCMYVLSCLPPGWLPVAGSSYLLTHTLFVLAQNVMMWAASSYRELSMRKDWLRLNVLQNAVRELEAERVDPDEIDCPSNSLTPSGAWTRKWIGQYVQATLSSPTRMDTGGFWCINASPFDIHVFTTNITFDLSASSISRTSTALIDRMSLMVESNQSEEHVWKRLSSSISLTIDTEDWIVTGYDNEVARKQLPCNPDGRRMGALKLVRGPNGLFLFSWSPPVEQRAMPLKEFEQFLGHVIACPGEWDCTALRTDGTRATITKKKGDHRRNMYDACQHLILPTAGRVDSSYAELETEFGPADLFASHVWGEEAGNTLAAIRRFIVGRSHFVEATIPATTDGTRGVLRSSRIVRNADICRIWFCTCCNNQTRVKEELGTDVAESPFARVIRSPVCTGIAVISPLLALRRKWCNYEFCLGHAANKSIALVTPAGIVQAGQVPPKELYDLAVELRDFSCADATCTSPQDAAMIDEAVGGMGGYQGLDANLKACFAQAIFSAHAWTSQAFQEISSPHAAEAMTCDGEWFHPSATIGNLALVGRTSL